MSIFVLSIFLLLHKLKKVVIKDKRYQISYSFGLFQVIAQIFQVEQKNYG